MKINEKSFTFPSFNYSAKTMCECKMQCKFHMQVPKMCIINLTLDNRHKHSY